MNKRVNSITVAVLCLTVKMIRTESSDTEDYYRYQNLLQTSEYPSSKVFPYAVAILKKSALHSTGVLISDIWVLTGADALYTVRENSRTLQVRLGSMNYKKGGTLLAVKWYEIHPFFDDQKPEFDVALIALAEVVNISELLKPIPMIKKLKSGQNIASHFTVPAWDLADEEKDANLIVAEEVIMQRRMLHVSLIHPLDSMNCSLYLDTLVLQSRESLLCLESDPYQPDPCARIPGAPVIVQGYLWGMISSWTPDNCNVLSPAPILVNLISSPHIRGWIRATMSGLQWNMTRNDYVKETNNFTSENDEDYDGYSDNSNK